MSGNHISDAFPIDWPNAQLVSPLHKQLEENDYIIEADSITLLHTLADKDMKEVQRLHEEWFPVRYSENFYKRLASGAVRIIIATANIVLTPKGEASGKRHKRRAIIGLLTYDIKPIKSSYLGFLDKLKSLFVLFSKVDILTLGVLLEFRKTGVGSLLLKELESVIASTERNKRVKVIVLQVIDHNQSAKAFYAKHGFRVHQELKDHYILEGKHFDGQKLVKYI